MRTTDASLKEYARGITGGLLFSLPMLYTMEMWWAGFILSPLRLLVYLLAGIGVLLIYNHFAGIRRAHTLGEGLIQSVEEMGIGILLTLAILWLTQRIAPGMSLSEIAGKTVVEAVTVAVGISVGKAQLGTRDDEASDKQSNENTGLYSTLGMALCGALLVSSNIAPTEEVVVIALESPVPKILLIAIISIALAGIILYASDFAGSENWVAEPSGKWDILLGTLATYTVALVSSALMLWFFHRFEGLSFYGVVAESVTLAFPASLGASAGRLLIQS